MKPIDIVLSLMDNTADHVQTINEAWEDGEEFWIGLDLATSLSFNISNVPALDPEDTEPGTFTFGDFFSLAMRISSGNLQGQEADEAIEAAALSANALEWNLWYRRILLNSLSKHLPMATLQKELIRLTSE
jgi:hypothetical protein